MAMLFCQKKTGETDHLELGLASPVLMFMIFSV